MKKNYQVKVKGEASKMMVFKLALTPDCEIEDFLITGDFFAEHPDILDSLPQELRNKPITDEVVKYIEKILMVAGVYGVDLPEAIDTLASLFKEAREACVRK